MFNIPTSEQSCHLLLNGWSIDKYYAHKHFKDLLGKEYEMEIEFYYGDNCVSLWDWAGGWPKNLLEPKKRCKDWEEVLETIKYLTNKYLQNGETKKEGLL